MAKLRRMSAKDARAILSRHGFTEGRQTGSHIIMEKELPGKTISVSVPNHKTIAIGTLASIIRQSKLPRSEFE